MFYDKYKHDFLFNIRDGFRQRGEREGVINLIINHPVASRCIEFWCNGLSGHSRLQVCSIDVMCVRPHLKKGKNRKIKGSRHRGEGAAFGRQPKRSSSLETTNIKL